jgi:hypothetical protein
MIRKYYRKAKSAYRLWKLKKQMEEYPEELKKMEENNEK